MATLSTHKITNCLWFDDQGEEAAEFYTSIFKNAGIKNTTHYLTETPSNKPKGSVLTVMFDLEGHQFMALNGGPLFKPNPSISFFVNCETEAEVDYFWEKFSERGEALMPLDEYPFNKKYGWVQDKFGLSWQIFLAEDELDQKIVPSLMFVGENTGKAEEAIHFYTSVFNGAEKGEIFRYEAGQEPDKEGTVAYADFKLEGQLLAAMDSALNHDFNFNEAISLIVNCETQDEIDYYWEKLSANPKAEQCGWLKDKFGVSWQVVPTAMDEMLQSENTEKSERAMEAML